MTGLAGKFPKYAVAQGPFTFMPRREQVGQDPLAILISDHCASHYKDVEHQVALKASNTRAIFVPLGCTAFVQGLDTTFFATIQGTVSEEILCLASNPTVAGHQCLPASAPHDPLGW